MIKLSPIQSKRHLDFVAPALSIIRYQGNSMYFTPLHLNLRIGIAMLAALAMEATVFGWQSTSTDTKRTDSAAKEASAKETSAKEEEMLGLVVKVIDGDSIKVQDENSKEVHEVQVEGTDAPEPKQEYGEDATKALRKLVLDRKVRITWSKKDNFDRRLAQIYVGDEHINRRMIQGGHAWHFKRYNQSKELAQLEDEARGANRGLWGAKNPQAPWDYRKENRTPDKPDR
jgi:micrococcal nuclease